MYSEEKKERKQNEIIRGKKGNKKQKKSRGKFQISPLPPQTVKS
jgi:hypothetical protein